MTGTQLKQVREKRGLTQAQSASRLTMTQGYFSMLEKGERRLTEELTKKVVRVFGLPAENLPLDKDLTNLPAWDESFLAAALAALGYSRFSHIKPSRLKNPAEVLISALRSNKLDPRIVEALPWLVLELSEASWKKVVAAAKILDIQNRLGFVVSLARMVAERRSEQKKAIALKKKEESLSKSRLMREDTLCSDFLTEAEKRWIRQNRTPEAEFWNLLSDFGVFRPNPRKVSIGNV
jgi:transcriptional regulator with XRE-family HTH domain